MQRLLIEILLDTSLDGMTTFAEIEHRALFRSEREVLFDCGALFNVTFVEYDWFSEIWNVKMVAVPKTSFSEHPYHSIVRETFIQNHSAIVAFGISMAHGFGKKDEAIRYFDQMLSAYSSDHIDIPDVLQQRAILHEKNGEHALAFRDYGQALDIRGERVRENLLGMASLHSNIGILYMATSDFQASLKSHRAALSIFEQLYGTEEDHVTKAKANKNIGLTYQCDSMSSKALEYLTRAQITYERILPEKHLLAIELLGHIRTVHEATNNFTLAIELFRRPLDWS
ncbi:unnamed protein product [Didymodactylos carnosus]|uniref:Tetratricopeptide repeat protein n=1 Tax=Didymodactylos carnosus TaxID=1234261 RepID=A0A814DPF2_9BILA|nr:unnamed protein product [Didymodactylos carnosus]CAF1202164.1 unnamed protein product [Didymodactylos carnosus]CAF3734590.1 unnamed protein product [Didymodactylos carnosus]CAF4011943.1 unnamed protein product [Didymodactylos carnosus]